MELNALLRRAVELGASDVHLKVGQPPIIRRDGSLLPIDDCAPLDEAALTAVLDAVGSSAPARLGAFLSSGDLDVAYQSDDLPRFRVNAFRQRGATSFAFRVIPKTVPTFAELELPSGVQRLAEQHRGLILVTGATGSGKTTTLAAMIDRICGCLTPGKNSIIRPIVSAASIVCIVERTRCPDSAAWRAVCAVSASRSSPIRITSGSWRSARRSACSNDSVSSPTSRWLTMQA